MTTLGPVLASRAIPRMSRVSLWYGLAALLAAAAVRLGVGAEFLSAGPVAIVVFVLVAGYPVALAVAWITGERDTAADDAIAETGADRADWGRGLIGAGALTLAVWICTGGAVPAPPERGSGAPAPAPRVAVLPLLDLDARGDRYFADGVTDEIVAGLAAVEGVEIRGRTSARAYVDVNRDAAEIGEALGAAAVLDGTLHRGAGRLRLTFRLLDVRTGDVVWAASRDTTAEAVFAVRDEVVDGVAGALGIEPAAGTRRRLERRRTDRRAFDLYLLGRFRWGVGAAGDLVEALSYYRMAIDADSAFAPAWVALADAYATLPRFTRFPVDDVRTDGAAAARTALRLDPDAAEAHTVLGEILYLYEHDQEAARAHLERATRLDPGDAAPRERTCELELGFGNPERAMAACRAALERDPLSFRVRWTAALAEWVDAGPDSGFAALDSLSRAYPDFEPLAGDAAVARLVSGDTTEASREALASWFRLLGAERAADTLAAAVIASAAGRPGADVLDRIARDLDPAAEHLAALLVVAGDTARALAVGAEALERRVPGALRLAGSPEFAALRARPEFRRRLEASGLR